jgi:hypothetical protein
MRRLLAVVCAVGALLSSAAVVTATSAQTFHFQFSSSGGEGVWSTLTGAPVTGALYRDTTIVAAPNRIRISGAPVTSPQVLFISLQYTFDAGGNMVPLSRIDTDGFPASLSFDQFLKGGSGNFSGAGENCLLDANGNPTTCSDVTLAISASWIGSGPLTHSLDTQRAGSAGEFRFSQVQTSQVRAASATAVATVDGAPLDLGQNTEADLFASLFGAIEVCVPNAFCP